MIWLYPTENHDLNYSIRSIHVIMSFNHCELKKPLRKTRIIKTIINISTVFLRTESSIVSETLLLPIHQYNISKHEEVVSVKKSLNDIGNPSTMIRRSYDYLVIIRDLKHRKTISILKLLPESVIVQYCTYIITFKRILWPIYLSVPSLRACILAALTHLTATQLLE